MLMLTKDDIRSLSPSAQEELKQLLFAKPRVDVAGLPDGFTADDFEDVVDLTPGQMEDFMAGCSAETVAGLKIIAENGPVIHASQLDAAGIDNYGHFQGRVTKRTRTITGNRDAYLFTWDDWTQQPGGVGHYVVTPATFRSLRIYFKLD